MSRGSVPLWRLMGDISITGPGGDLTQDLGNKAIAMLAYLALSPEGATRSELAPLLWPHQADPRHNLRQCRAAIRVVFGDWFDEIFENADDPLVLNQAAVEIDARVLLQTGDGSRVPAKFLIDFCRGPFLRGLTTRAKPFDDWAALQRSHLKEVAGGVLGEALVAATRANRRDDVSALSGALVALGIPPPSAKRSPPRRSNLSRRWRRIARGAAVSLGFGLAFSAVGVASYLAIPRLEAPLERILSRAIPTPARIAVLPFTAVNGTAEEIALAQGVTLGVNYGLYSIAQRELFVVTTLQPSHTSRETDLARIADELNVRYLITGFVAVEEGTVRVDAQSIDTRGGRGNVGRNGFRMPTARAFDLQDEITRWILNEFSIHVTPDEEERIRRLNDTNNLDAWLSAINGVRHLVMITRKDIEVAKGYYQGAISIDKNYVSAIRGLAWVYLIRVRLGWADSPQEEIHEAERLLEVAMRSGPDDGIAKSLQGAILLLKGDYDAAVEAGRFARKMLPGSSDVAAVLAHTLTYVGEQNEALSLIDRAMELSPAHPGFYRWTKGRALRLAKRYSEAIAELEKDLGVGEPAIAHLVELTASYSAAGRLSDARRIGERIRGIDSDFSAEVWLQHPRIKDPEVQSSELKLLTDAGL